MLRQHVLRPVLLAVLAAGCQLEPTSPGTGAAIGSYVASLAASSGSPVGAIVFTSTTSGVSTDWIRSGASIRLTLHRDGLTTGLVEMPGINEEGEMEAGAVWRADLAGTWQRDGLEVHLSHQADTFLRDITFRVSDNTLVADEDVGGVRVRVVLERQ
jgi:hypothetical protein